MGLSVAEFLRLFPSAAEGHAYRIQGKRITLHHPAGEIQIHFSAQSPRTLASLTIPVTRVEIDLSRLHNQDRQSFMERFEIHYQRGGG